MPFFGFLMAAFLFCHFNRRLRHYRRRIGDGDACSGGWDRQWSEQWQRHARRAARRAAREATRWGRHAAEPAKSLSPEEEALRRARRRAAAQAGFYAHLMSYLGVIAFLALINLFTTRYPWFIWPALGWGIGLFSHWMAVFGSHLVRERYFDPAVERELRPKLDAAKIAISRNYIAGPTVQADAEKLRQVFANLVDNAIDALATIPEGRRIDLFLENGAGLATVRVRDNGCGIAPEKLDRIFNPFFTTKEKGTGLGMAISKKIVEAHEGAIEVASEVGRGTEFKITLPLPAKS